MLLGSIPASGVCVPLVSRSGVGICRTVGVIDPKPDGTGEARRAIEVLREWDVEPATGDLLPDNVEECARGTGLGCEGAGELLPAAIDDEFWIYAYIKSDGCFAIHKDLTRVQIPGLARA